MTMGIVRHLLSLLIVLLIGIGIATPAATMLAPMMDRELFAIRGSSMTPTIPLGALSIVAERPASELRVGDVVTWRGDNGVYVTHRVTELLEANGQRYVRTKGDANLTADPEPVPERAIIGVVDAWVPFGGYALLALATPSGLVAWLSFAMALLVLDSLLGAGTPRNTTRARPAALAQPAGEG